MLEGWHAQRGHGSPPQRPIPCPVLPFHLVSLPGSCADEVHGRSHLPLWEYSIGHSTLEDFCQCLLKFKVIPYIPAILIIGMCLKAYVSKCIPRGIYKYY